MSQRTRMLIIACAAAATMALVAGVTQALTGDEQRRSLGLGGDMAAASPRVTHGAIDLEGQRWAVVSYRNAAGDLCIGETVPGGGQATGCMPEAELFRSSPIDLHVGARQVERSEDLTRWDNVWVWGVVAQNIDSIRILLSDCSSRSVPVDDDGVFVSVYGSSTLHGNVWPMRVIGYDASGSEIAVRDVPLSPPPTDEARRAGTKPPRLAAC